MNKENRYRLSEDELELLLEHRANGIDNINENSVLDLYLKDRGIDKKDVISVKHWQSASGEPRFSIVTKENRGLNSDGVISKLKEFLENRAPKYDRIKYVDGDHLLVINPADIHIGKYCSVNETGEAYDRMIAVSRVVEGLEGLIQKSKGFKVDRILFCIGNDILHVDNVYNQTTKGTPQDVDGKWWEHFEIALELYVRCVERLREIAPVDCVHSMSNHDYQSGFHLAHALKAWFRKDKSVTVDASARHRKYYMYGNNLIGLEHGDGAKMDHLPLIMAQEKPQEWANAKYRYWYLHHLHHKVKYKWRDAKDFIGVTVEYLRSPSAADSWHARKGYIGTPTAVEAFVHSKFSGQVARLTHFF
tara:strand:+ start:4452 stop:5534 length:1083 start_codon:yes stop_codon:yes gene_type:complete